MAQFKSTMREIMTLAWGFVRRNGYTIGQRAVRGIPQIQRKAEET